MPTSRDATGIVRALTEASCFEAWACLSLFLGAVQAGAWRTPNAAVRVPVQRWMVPDVPPSLAAAGSAAGRMLSVVGTEAAGRTQAPEAGPLRFHTFNLRGLRLQLHERC